jgi:hypothetical protein
MKHKEWFKLKTYPHIGFPLNIKDKKNITSYIKNKDKVKNHNFMPFIHKTISSRKLRKEYDKEGNLLNNGLRKIGDTKKRDIYYSNHYDANIFSYYGHLINIEYEKILLANNLENVITAYRQIPIIEGDKIIRNKCNIDFANEVFSFIKNTPFEETVAITFDIKGFFDNLNHNLLKKSWCSIFGWDKLEEDHYNVYKNITKFSFVEEHKLFELFKDSIITKTKSGQLRKKKVDKLKYLFNSNAIAFCEKDDIHIIRKNGLINKNKYHNGKLRDYGICQGSPISSVLANIYLLEFDKLINLEVEKVNGLYRRYSDDMVIVCHKKDRQHFIDLVEYQITNLTKLEIQKKKTQIFHFYYKTGRLICGQEFENKLNHNSEKRNFEYLGFSFNGEIVSLKTSSLAKYYRKLKLNVRRCKYYSSIIDNDSNGQIFRKRLYKKFSYIGAKRIKKYRRKKGTTNEWIVTNQYNWGNYITYAKLASKTIKNSNIKSQIKKHWKNLNNQINND